jgi:lysophospholipase L1-like esterase
MFKKIIWPILLVTSIVLIFIFIGGLMKSINITTVGEELIENEPPTDVVEEMIPFDELTNYNILTLGDSIGVGSGDEEGLDIAQRYKALLQASEEITVETHNLAINGLRTNELRLMIDEAETTNAINAADLIIISIGGNDLKDLLGTQQSTLIAYEELLAQYIEDFNAILEYIRTNNNNATVAVIGLYNPEGSTLALEQLNLMFDWNYETESLVASIDRSIYVPTYDLFKYNLNQMLSVDDFHPNGIGYQAIAERLYHVLNKFN